MTVGERIQLIRKDHGYTQKEFGEKLSLVASMICLLENGTANITERTIKSICNEFNVNREWLLTGEGEKYNNEKSTETLTVEFAEILGKYPSLYETAKMVSNHMTTNDWRRVNQLLEEMGG